jgi:hypothetical protein
MFDNIDQLFFLIDFWKMRIALWFDNSEMNFDIFD